MSNNQQKIHRMFKAKNDQNHIFQYILPFVFIGLPLIAEIVAIVRRIKTGAISSDKRRTEIAFAVIEMYAMCNALMLLLFISPYRKHTARLLGIGILQRICWKMNNQIASTANGERQRQQVGMGRQPPAMSMPSLRVPVHSTNIQTAQMAAIAQREQRSPRS